MTDEEKMWILNKLQQLYDLFENLQKQVDALQIDKENVV